ncbi:hypothetical protein TRVA0_030S01574 [Trichomonascus vanleenenianus]|uniref:uncharacterized protein n=1 Tax=Trichomonascus vanleenenianus TaxID=2268995 RepID=UPI003ECB921D
MKEKGPSLQKRCNAILDDEDILEEDKIEQVEEQVAREYPGMKPADLERLVLDILWKHRDMDSEEAGQDDDEVLRVVEMREMSVSGSAAATAPLPSDYTKLEKPESSSASPSAAASSTGTPIGKWTPKQGSYSPEFTKQESHNVQELSPFDVLRQILGEENSDEDIHQALEMNDFDVQRTLNLLINNRNDSGAIMCKYYVQFGECLRSDCRYSHDLSGRICRFWLKGSCLAGESCPFLHEIPLDQLSLGPVESHPPPAVTSVNLNDQDDFPVLGQKPQKKKKNNMATSTQTSVSRQIKRTPVSISSPIKIASKINRSKVKLVKPRRIPWETPDFQSNRQYISLRNQAAKHGEMRNKYLQLAVSSWHKNNPAQASILSDKGQLQNDRMVECHLKASDLLYSQRNNADSEAYIDLHGMDLDSSVDRLAEVLAEVESEPEVRPLYAICGIGHHFDRGAQQDNLSRVVKEFLDKKAFHYVEYTPSESKKYGKIIAIDPWSHI